jgi:hypothetical protein
MSTLNKIKVEDTLYDIEDTKARNGLINKVEKVEGKQLSTNDFTKEYKEKLDGLSNYDDTELRNKLGDKQDNLVSGQNIKTINGESILGIGDIEIQGGTSGDTADFEVLIDFTTEQTVAEFQVPIGNAEIVEKIKKATDVYLIMKVPRDTEDTTDSAGTVTVSLYTSWKHPILSNLSIIPNPTYNWVPSGVAIARFTNPPILEGIPYNENPCLVDVGTFICSQANSDKNLRYMTALNLWKYDRFGSGSYFTIAGTRNMYKGTRFVLGVSK